MLARRLLLDHEAAGFSVPSAGDYTVTKRHTASAVDLFFRDVPKNVDKPVRLCYYAVTDTKGVVWKE